MFWIGKPAYLRRFGQLDDHIRTIESAGSHFRAGGGYLGNLTLFVPSRIVKGKFTD